MKITDSQMQAGANNLTLVRLALASAVIWSHSYWRISGISGQDTTSWLLHAPVSQFAVDGFFFLSGFLVYASLQRRGRVGDFVLARLTRLWPGLAVCVALTIAAGAWLTVLPLQAYLRGDTLGFMRGNLLLIGQEYSLSGVMCGAAPCTVNGSLWTIAWEVRCYTLLAIAALLGLARPWVMQQIVLPASLVFALILHFPGVEVAVRAHLGHGIAHNLLMADRLWSAFALGIAAWLWRGRLVLNWWMAAALTVGGTIMAHFGLGAHGQQVATGYLVLCAGFLSAKHDALSAAWPDYSYGMYIYAFPVMMILAGSAVFGNFALLALATFVATLPLAALSWHFVEKPALDLFRNLNRRRDLENVGV